MFVIFKTPQGKKFLVAVMVVFIISVSLVSRAAFRGVEEQYNLPMETWDLSLFILQAAWVAIYSIMFTIIGSLPFGFYFLGPTEGQETT